MKLMIRAAAMAAVTNDNMNLKPTARREIIMKHSAAAAMITDAGMNAEFLI